MRKEEIDEFLEKNKEIGQSIEKIASRYSLADFVRADKPCKDYFENKEIEVGKITGCLYNERENYLLLEPNSVELRLRNEYMEFLVNLIKEKDENNKVFYIIAYHYLELCKQIGYWLIEANDSPFPFLGDKISPLGKSNYEEYKRLMNKEFCDVIPVIGMNDLEYYHKIFKNCGKHHHSKRYFSLIDYIIPCSYMVSRYDFDDEFERRLDLFVFRYKAIYTTEFLFVYMDRDSKEKVINSLINL